MIEEAIIDTGPIIHLSEIEQIKLLKQIFKKIFTSRLIGNEITKYDIEISDTPIEIFDVSLSELKTLPKNIHLPEYSLIELSNKFKIKLILTDDLDFRNYITTLKITPVGTIGILIKAYTYKIISKEELKNYVYKLFDFSSLFLSDVFKEYILKKINDL